MSGHQAESYNSLLGLHHCPAQNELAFHLNLILKCRYRHRRRARDLNMEFILIFVIQPILIPTNLDLILHMGYLIIIFVQLAQIKFYNLNFMAKVTLLMFDRK
jgi:hypothetical protein